MDDSMIGHSSYPAGLTNHQLAGWIKRLAQLGREHNLETLALRQKVKQLEQKVLALGDLLAAHIEKELDHGAR